MEYLVVGLGGFLGANARYLAAGWVTQRLGPSFPYGTLFVNVTGSFIIGLFLVGFGERLAFSSHYRLFFTTGFLGAYTTFSTFSYETLILMYQQNWPALVANVGGNVLLCLGGVALGAWVGRSL